MTLFCEFQEQSSACVIGASGNPHFSIFDDRPNRVHRYYLAIDHNRDNAIQVGSGKVLQSMRMLPGKRNVKRSPPTLIASG